MAETPASSTDTEEPIRNAAEADIGIVSALAMEVAPFAGRCLPVQSYKGDRFHIQGLLLHDTRIAVVESGAGAVLAARATQTLLDGHAPAWVLSVGFSGALQPHLKLGDLVVANAIVNTEGKGLSVDVRMQSSPSDGLYVGKFVNADHIVRTVEEKKQLGESTGAIAVDMESLAVARVCANRQVKFMSVRVISDDLPMMGEKSAEMSHRPDHWRRIFRSRTNGRRYAIFNEHDCRNWNDDWRE